MAGETIVSVFQGNVSRLGERSALRRRVGEEWRSLTWGEYGRAVAEVAAGLAEVGLQPGEAAGILSSNRVEWHVVDVAILASGAVSVPLYLTAVPVQVAYVLGHSEARLCFVENVEQLAKLAGADLPRLERVVIFEDEGPAQVLGPSAGVTGAEVLSLARLRELGAARLSREPSLVNRLAGAVGPDQLATLVYTSGTTGPPKGAMLTHGNITWTCASAAPLLDPTPDDRFLSYLPLSHIAERMVSHFGQIWGGGETWFARSLQTVLEDLSACRPTLFFAVPRVWEKARDGIRAKVAAEKGIKRTIAERYLALGAKSVATSLGEGRMSRIDQQIYRRLDHLVGAKMRHGFGLDKARTVGSGAAAIAPSVLRFFHGIGLPIAEIYGLTESCGPASMNPPGRIRLGTVGPAIPGVSLRLASDGEILIKGGNVCGGYFKDERATAELIDSDGWAHSGDVGVLDDQGYLRITDRKKDLIVTSSGKNVAPQELENRLKLEPLVSQAVVVGDGRNYLTALITLDPEAVARWAAARGKPEDPAPLADDPDLLAEVAEGVGRVNQERSSAEGIKRWKLLAGDFTVEGGELTPTLKVRRREILSRHADLVEELYR